MSGPVDDPRLSAAEDPGGVHAREEIQRLAADILGVEIDDLTLVANRGTTYTFREQFSGRDRTFSITMGPNGPTVASDT